MKRKSKLMILITIVICAFALISTKVEALNAAQRARIQAIHNRLLDYGHQHRQTEFGEGIGQAERFRSLRTICRAFTQEEVNFVSNTFIQEMSMLSTLQRVQVTQNQSCYVLGDIHSDIGGLASYVETAEKKGAVLAVLGDYNDRGENGIECGLLAMTSAILHRDWAILFGNHDVFRFCIPRHTLDRSQKYKSLCLGRYGQAMRTMASMAVIKGHNGKQILVTHATFPILGNIPDEDLRELIDSVHDEQERRTKIRHFKWDSFCREDITSAEAKKVLLEMPFAQFKALQHAPMIPLAQYEQITRSSIAKWEDFIKSPAYNVCSGRFADRQELRRSDIGLHIPSSMFKQYCDENGLDYLISGHNHNFLFQKSHCYDIKDHYICTMAKQDLYESTEQNEGNFAGCVVPTFSDDGGVNIGEYLEDAVAAEANAYHIEQAQSAHRPIEKFREFEVRNVQFHFPKELRELTLALPKDRPFDEHFLDDPIVYQDILSQTLEFKPHYISTDIQLAMKNTESRFVIEVTKNGNFQTLQDQNQKLFYKMTMTDADSNDRIGTLDIPVYSYTVNGASHQVIQTNQIDDCIKKNTEDWIQKLYLDGFGFDPFYKLPTMLNLDEPNQLEGLTIYMEKYQFCPDLHIDDQESGEKFNLEDVSSLQITADEKAADFVIKLRRELLLEDRQMVKLYKVNDDHDVELPDNEVIDDENEYKLVISVDHPAE